MPQHGQDSALGFSRSSNPSERERARSTPGTRLSSCCSNVPGVSRLISQCLGDGGPGPHPLPERSLSVGGATPEPRRLSRGEWCRRRLRRPVRCGDSSASSPGAPRPATPGCLRRPPARPHSERRSRPAGPATATGIRHQRLRRRRHRAGRKARRARVTAALTEFRIALSQTTFTPGTYTFVAVNSGRDVHSLEIDGPGVDNQKTANLQPGQTANLTVTFQSGSYDVFCPVDSHKELGMNLELQVSG